MGWRSKRWIAVAVTAARAALAAGCGLTTQQLPWIPDAQPDTLLLGKGLTGEVLSFAAMFSPWADSLGGAG